MEIVTTDQLRLLSKARRQELQLTQQTLAGRAGVSRKWLSEFELGKGGADLSLVIRLIAALELRLDLSPAGRPDQPDQDADADLVDLDALLASYQTRGQPPG